MSSTDYPGAEAHFIPESFSFSRNDHLAIVIHKTASGGPGGLQAVYNTFMATERSTHYGIDLDGSVWQFVPESRGAGGNCCLENGHNPFWDPYLAKYGNLNLCTISIEHVDPSADNSTPMPPAQVEASHKLVAYLCNKYKIAEDHIHSHASLDPGSRARCPGPTYDFAALFASLKQPPPIDQTAFYKRAAFESEWRAILPDARLDSGIANAAWEAYQAEQYRGPALTHESSQLKDWQGHPIVVQLCAGGRYEWDSAGAHWYAYQ